MRRHGAVLELVLNRPGVHNALNAALRDGLVAGLELAHLDPSVKEVVLRGEGATFSSGGDLDEFGTFADPASAHVVSHRRGAPDCSWRSWANR